MNEWMPISTAPSDRLIEIGKYNDPLGWCWIVLGKYSYGSLFERFCDEEWEPHQVSWIIMRYHNNPTHWRESPDPPK